MCYELWDASLLIIVVKSDYLNYDIPSVYMVSSYNPFETSLASKR